MMAFLFFFLTQIHAQELKSLKVKVLERGTKLPMSQVNVFILPQKVKATTDEQGYFAVELPQGEYSLIINVPGYQKTQTDVNLVKGESVTEILVEKSVYNPYETTVQTKATTVQTGQKNITAAEASKIAGTGGDTLRAVQTMPGIARTSYGSGNVSIRGSAPNETSYLIDGHETPIIFHFGGLASVVNTDLIDEIIYLPGGYGSPYGRANGGLIGVTLRDPKNERLTGYVFADVINAGFLVESPLGAGWKFGATARRSYIGDVLKFVAKNNPNFDLTVAPYYYDGLISVAKRFSDKQSLRFSLLGSYDELSFLIKEPVETAPAIRGSINNQTKFWRFITSYKDQITEDDLFRTSFSLGPDFVHVDVNEIYFDLYTMNYSLRSDWEHRLTLHHATRLGIDSIINQNKVKFNVPSSSQQSPISSANLVEGEAGSTQHNLGLFAEHRMGLLEDPEKWILTPGVRFDHFSDTDETYLSPRLNSRFAFNEHWALRGATGIYYQPPEPQYSDPLYGNTAIRSPMAYHYVLGVEALPAIGWFNSLLIETDVFYKDLRRQVVPDALNKYSNDGSGRAYGFETFIKARKDRWSGWLSYTLSGSTRTSPSNGETTFQYDQTHNVTLVANYKTDSGWEYGLRARYVTGNPITPVVDARYDADNDLYVPERGTPYSARMRSFFQADFRIDKKWTFDTWILNLYLDLQNMTNAKNVESISYSYDFSRSQEATGLPVIPSLGIKAEF